MDIISHGLWGGALLGTEKKRYFWPSFAFGMLPDLLAFTVPFILMIIKLMSGDLGGFANGRPAYLSQGPNYVTSLYAVGHSLIIFAIVFGIVWIIRKKPYIPMFAWMFHILLDIFTHGNGFFQTPFLWPVSDYKFNGTPWSSPSILIPDIISLIVVYAAIYIYKHRKENTAK